jgi:glycosyltransferase involved in cell wall biosynthesis
MHVLYFHQHFSTPEGATGTRSYEMARALIRKGHSVTIVCGSYSHGNTGLFLPFSNGFRRGFVDGIDVIEFKLNYGNDMGYPSRVWAFIKFAFASIKVALLEPADIIFATSTPLTAAIPGIFARWIRRKPFVFEVRDLWPELPKAMGVITNPVFLGLMGLLEWVAYRSANRLIGLSPGIAEGIAGRGIDKSRISMIPNGSDIDLFSGPISSWRPESVSGNDFLAIFTGTHGVANGLDAVLCAAAVLKRQQRNDIKIALVGQGSEKASLMKRAEIENLDNILFLDPVPKTQVSGLMAGADIGLQILANFPAFYRGTSPNKFFDYIASGLPVLNNYPGWLAEMIQKYECGYVVEPGMPQEFANLLIRAADNPDETKKFAKNAENLAKECFNRDILSAAWVAWVVGANNNQLIH